MPIVMNFSKAGNAADGRLDGVSTIQGGVYGKLRINGVCTVEGDLEAESLDIDGVCTCMGSVTAKKFDCDGVLKVKGNMRLGKADVDGVVTVEGNKIEADEIKCDGVVNVAGEISADVINANGKINAEAIVGDFIAIKSYWKTRLGRLLLLIGEKINTKQSVVDLIEGTTVELRGVRAKSVNGHDVTIGKNCEVDRVDASGILYIDPTSRVTEVANA